MPTTPHLHILAEAAPLLASLDLDESLRRLEHLVVPEIADWCTIHLVDDEGGISRVEVTHRDPARAALLRDLERRFPPRSEGSTVHEVMRSGRGKVLSEVTDAMLVRSAHDEQHLRDLCSLAVQSMITVPLRARGRTLGAMTLLTERGGRVYDDKWLGLAESVAALAALAVDNAHLYAEVRHAHTRLEAILRGIPEGITVESDDGRVVFANDSAARSLGYENPEALMATPIATIIERHDVLDEQGEALPYERLPGRRALRGEVEPSELICYRVRATGQSRWTQVRASRLPEEREGHAFAVNVIQDVTAHIEYERKLEDAAARQASLARELEDIVEQVRAEREVAEQARAEAEQASAAKTQFLAVVSHELRTPLNAISGFTELLAMQVGGSMTETQLEYVSRIDSSTRHLTGLIEQILMFSRIESGREDLDLEEMDIGVLTLEVADLLEPLARRKGLRFERRLAQVPMQARVDAARMRQILLNLVGNAIKFTDSGSVTVSVEPSGQEIEVLIADTGQGIPPHEMERIFEPFTQVDASATRRVGGTGLGLAVSRHLARLMGGDIRADSSPGAGSRFRLSLPAIQ
ncbi:MAG TPA: ATP-binding protein [Longimicrobiales bacterium]|nr:ATP-binding protein [Longimicrobiales bacterium]